MRRIQVIGFLLLGGFLPWHAQAQSPTQPVAAVHGAGASFPSLVYSAWTSGYSKEKGQEVQYVATGSGDGVKQMNDRTVDFGATDTPLTETELKTGGLIQFPTMAGGIVPVVNLKGVANGALKLTGPVLADLMSGDIAAWDDPRIASLNPDIALPRTRVVRIARKDSSGSTAILTEYLSQQSPAWANGTGVGKTVKWNSDVVLAKGNDDLAAAVKATPGAIGYVSYDRVLRDGLAAVSLRNKAGNFVPPSEASIRAAVKGSMFRKSSALTASLIDMPGVGVWPIVDLTYILLDAAPKSAEQASATARFFYWAFLKGDALISGTGFAPLPTEVQALAVRKLVELRAGDGKPLNFTRRPAQMMFTRWIQSPLASPVWIAPTQTLGI